MTLQARIPTAAMVVEPHLHDYYQAKQPFHAPVNLALKVEEAAFHFIDHS